MAELSPMQQFTGSTDFQELTPDQRAQAVLKFQKMSAKDQAAFVQDLVPATAPSGESADMPDIATRAKEALPYAVQASTHGSQDVGSVLSNVGTNVLRQVAAATPLNPLARVYQAVTQHQPGGTSLMDRAVDILGYQPTPKEVAAQAIFMGITGGLGGVLGKAAPGLAPIVEPLLSLGAHDVNVRLGLSEPGALGYAASAALPIAVRGVGAMSGAIAKRSGAGKLLGEYDTAMAQRENTMAQQALEHSNAMAKEGAAYDQRVTKSLQDYLDAIDTRNATRAQRQAAQLKARNEQIAFQTSEMQRKADLANTIARKEYEGALTLREQQLQANAEAADTLKNVTSQAWGGPRSGTKATIKAAYDAVEKMGDPTIPWGNVRKVAQEIMDEVALTVPQFQDHPLYKAAQGFRDMGKAVDAAGTSTLKDPLFSEVRPNLTHENLGGMVVRYMDRGGRTSGLIQKLQGTVMDAMAQGGGEANVALRHAAGLARKDFALQDFEALVTPSAPGSAVRLNEQNMLEVRPAVLFNGLQKLKNNPYWTRSLTPAELERIDRGVEFLKTLERVRPAPAAPTPVVPGELPPKPPLRDIPFSRMPTPREVAPPRDIPVEPPPLPVQMGEAPLPSLRRTMLGGSIGAGLGASLGYATGVGYGPGSAIGALVGASAPEIGRVLSQALLSPRGQPLLRKLLARDLMIAPHELGLLNAALRKSNPLPAGTDAQPE